MTVLLKEIEASLNDNIVLVLKDCGNLLCYPSLYNQVSRAREEWFSETLTFS